MNKRPRTNTGNIGVLTSTCPLYKIPQICRDVASLAQKQNKADQGRFTGHRFVWNDYFVLQIALDSAKARSSSSHKKLTPDQVTEQPNTPKRTRKNTQAFLMNVSKSPHTHENNIPMYTTTCFYTS